MAPEVARNYSVADRLKLCFRNKSTENVDGGDFNMSLKTGLLRRVCVSVSVFLLMLLCFCQVVVGLNNKWNGCLRLLNSSKAKMSKIRPLPSCTVDFIWSQSLCDRAAEPWY